MLLNQLAEGRFSAIAASFNPALKRDSATAWLRPLAPRWAHHKGELTCSWQVR